MAEDCETNVAVDDALYSEGGRSTVAGAGESSSCCSLCVASGSLGEEPGAMAREDEVIAVAISVSPSVQEVLPNVVSGAVKPATFVTTAAEGVLLA
jgi:hypothetical protein